MRCEDCLPQRLPPLVAAWPHLQAWLCGQGFCDAPGLKLIGAIDPSDIVQGKIGNCWRKLYEISRRASSWHTSIWQGSNVGYL